MPTDPGITYQELGHNPPGGPSDPKLQYMEEDDFSDDESTVIHHQGLEDSAGTTVNKWMENVPLAQVNLSGLSSSSSSSPMNSFSLPNHSAMSSTSSNNCTTFPKQRVPPFSPFSAAAYSSLRIYILELQKLDKSTDSSLDRFKFTVVGSDQIHDVSLHADAGASSNEKHLVSSKPYSHTTFTISIGHTPYYTLIHSLKAFVLALSIIHFAKTHTTTLTLYQQRLCVLLTVSILNTNLNVRRVALGVYLQMVNNRISRFLSQCNILDRRIRQRINCMQNSCLKNRNLTMQHLFGSKWTHTRQRSQSSEFLLRSVLTTLIAAFNERLVELMPLIDDLNHLYQYTQLYKIGIDSSSLSFLNMLNHPAPVETPKLRPLRLNSGDLHLNDSSSESSQPVRRRPASLQEQRNAYRRTSSLDLFKSQRHRSVSAHDSSSSALSSTGSLTNMNQLPANSYKLAQQFTSVRRLFLCCLLSLIETSHNENSESPEGFKTICIRRFNLSKRSFHHVTRPTRIYLAMKAVEKTQKLMECLCEELDETEQSEEPFDLSGTIMEEDEDKNTSELATILDNLSSQVGMLEINSNIGNTQNQLHTLKPTFDRLFTLYERCIGVKQEDERNLRGITLSKREEMARKRHSSVDIKKRRSSGLNFGLLSVVKQDDADDTSDEVSPLRISTGSLSLDLSD